MTPKHSTSEPESEPSARSQDIASASSRPSFPSPSPRQRRYTLNAVQQLIDEGIIENGESDRRAGRRRS